MATSVGPLRRCSARLDILTRAGRTSTRAGAAPVKVASQSVSQSVSRTQSKEVVRRVDQWIVGLPAQMCLCAAASAAAVVIAVTAAAAAV